MLKANAIHYRAGAKEILRNIHLEFHPGQFNMILGPNGSGKSTLLKICSGGWQGYEGRVSYDEQELRLLKPEAVARYRAVMSQQPDLQFPLTTAEVVMMGRYPHFSMHPSARDHSICEAVMERMDLLPFKSRNYLTLSGGEKQRVQFARVLAQLWETAPGQTRYFFLDEPLASLDINFQQELLQITKELLNPQTVLVAIMHDINLAVHYGDRLFFLKNGELVAQGPPSDVLTSELIHAVFDIPVEIIRHPRTLNPMIIYQ